MQNDAPSPGRPDDGVCGDACLTPEDWDRIEQAYRGSEPLADVGARYGITMQKIVAHARREDWPLRGARKTKTLRGAGHAHKTKQASAAALMKRLTRLVEQQIDDIEKRLKRKAASQDHERDARTLSNLTRTLDKLIELKRSAEADRAARARAKRDDRKATGSDRDEDALRADLAGRLARLAAAGNRDGVSGQSERN